MHMLSFGRREMEGIKRSAARMFKRLQELRSASAKSVKQDIMPPIDRFQKTLDASLDRYSTIQLWQVVMLVTCVEAYLHDVLCAAEKATGEFMRESEQVARYQEIVTAASLDDLADELRGTWAENWISRSGPEGWVTRLTKMGASGYPDGLGQRLELYWGIRHLVVHGAGVVTRDFLRRHPRTRATVGVRIRVTNADFGAFVRAMSDFLKPTEKFFLARCPSLAVKMSPPEEPTGVLPTPRGS